MLRNRCTFLLLLELYFFQIPCIHICCPSSQTVRFFIHRFYHGTKKLRDTIDGQNYDDVYCWFLCLIYGLRCVLLWYFSVFMLCFYANAHGSRRLTSCVPINFYILDKINSSAYSMFLINKYFSASHTIHKNSLC